MGFKKITPRVASVRFDGKTGESVVYDGTQHRTRDAAFGYLAGAVLRHRAPNPEQQFRGGVELTLALADEPGGRPTLSLSVMESTVFGNTLYNALGERAVSGDTQLEIGVRTSGEGKDQAHRLYVLRDGIEAVGAFAWSDERGDERGWFEGVPEPVDTGEKNGMRPVYDKRAANVKFREVMVEAVAPSGLWYGGQERPARFAELWARVDELKRMPKPEEYNELLLQVRHDLLDYHEQRRLLDALEAKFGDHGLDPSVLAGSESAVAVAGSADAGPASGDDEGQGVPDDEIGGAFVDDVDDVGPVAAGASSLPSEGPHAGAEVVDDGEGKPAD